MTTPSTENEAGAVESAALPDEANKVSEGASPGVSGADSGVVTRTEAPGADQQSDWLRQGPEAFDVPVADSRPRQIIGVSALGIVVVGLLVVVSSLSAGPPDRTGDERITAPPTTASRPRPARSVQAAADDPYRAVHHVYRAIANGLATGCAVFSPTAAQQFAAHFGAPDCAAAITQLTTQVTHPIEYASTAEQSPDVYLDDTVTISSCTIRPEGGPPLGRFTLRRTEHDKWYISGHETEECSVAPVSTPAAPVNSPEAPLSSAAPGMTSATPNRAAVVPSPSSHRAADGSTEQPAPAVPAPQSSNRQDDGVHESTTSPPQPPPPSAESPPPPAPPSAPEGWTRVPTTWTPPRPE